MDEELRNVAILLYKIDCLLFGKFKLSSEIILNAYFDLARVFSYPDILNETCNVACNLLKKKNLIPQNICGVSYSGIPFAVLISNKLNVPLLIRNKEVNLYAEDNRIEGKIVKDAGVMIVEEIMCSGTSTLQVIKDVEDAGMKVEHVFVIVDLEQGGFENLRKLGYKSYSLLKMSQIGNILFETGLINKNHLEDIRQGWQDNFVVNGDVVTNTKLAERLSMKYETRMEYVKSEISLRLLQIIFKKKSNICIDLSLCKFTDIIKTANLIGPYICILCLHLNAYDELSTNEIFQLQSVALKYDFLLMDDCKLSETGSVLRYKLKKVLNIVNLVSVLPLNGENSIKEINSITKQMPNKGIFLTASLFTEDSLHKSSFEKDVIDLGISQCLPLVGFISHQNSKIPIEYIHMMSDLRSTGSVVNNVKKSYYSSNEIIETLGADIVMLFFSENHNILESVKQHQRILWKNYENRFN